MVSESKFLRKYYLRGDLMYLRVICYYYQFSVFFSCQTPTCHVEADRFSDIMDTEADPCEDFSQFVCGKYYTDPVTDKRPADHALSFAAVDENRK